MKKTLITSLLLLATFSSLSFAKIHHPTTSPARCMAWWLMDHNVPTPTHGPIGMVDHGVIANVEYYLMYQHIARYQYWFKILHKKDEYDMKGFASEPELCGCSEIVFSQTEPLTGVSYCNFWSSP